MAKLSDSAPYVIRGTTAHETKHARRVATISSLNRCLPLLHLSMSTVTFSNAKFQDYMMGAIVTTLTLTITIVNIKDYVLHPNKSKPMVLFILFSITVCFINSVIKTIEFVGLDIPLAVDVLKSFCGQLINPLAMFAMYLRGQALFSHRTVRIALGVVAYIGLLIGFVTPIIREYLSIRFPDSEDTVFNGLRSTVGIISNLYATLCQLGYSMLFLFELSQTLEIYDFKMVFLVAMESLFIFGGVLFYAFTRHMNIKITTSLLPMVGAVSIRFMLDIQRQVKKAIASTLSGSSGVSQHMKSVA
jgi:hypothetical protein